MRRRRSNRLYPSGKFHFLKKFISFYFNFISVSFKFCSFSCQFGYNRWGGMDVLRTKVCEIHEEDHDIRRLRCHPTKTITMEIGFVFFFKKKTIKSYIRCPVISLYNFFKPPPYYFFRSKKHLGILDPTAPRKLINVEMHEKMKEADFQNFVFPCCGLVKIRKWGVEHN